MSDAVQPGDGPIIQEIRDWNDARDLAKCGRQCKGGLHQICCRSLRKGPGESADASFEVLALLLPADRVEKESVLRQAQMRAQFLLRRRVRRQWRRHDMRDDRNVLCRRRDHPMAKGRSEE